MNRARINRPVRAARNSFALCFLVAAVGCLATRGEVRRIVTSSNLALAEAGGALPASEASTGSWEAEVARIDRLIAANEGSDVLVHTLRLRQALVLTVHGRGALAEATFDLVDRGFLQTTRDRALYDGRDALVWWFGVAKPLGAGELTAARRHLGALATVVDGLPRSSGTGDYLAEIRAWIAVQTARSLPEARATEAAELLSGGLGLYAARFDPADLAWMRAYWAGDAADAAPPRDDVPIEALRLRLRARAVVREYREVRRLRREENAAFAPDWSGAATAALLDVFPG